ncbi:NAD-dependent epimerase/dehydratase family protein [Persicobacter psychrovividus]|uniref:HpnA protein n=1 Tax=Persicobacter psychrovividus TaxID=387638 RepID=A0ABM7VAD1_9BACT|nr:HpnA protein [Persicobacter psychrovividus]
MKVLVTGANGLLGSNVIRALLQKGYEPKAMVRPKANIKGFEGLNVEIFYGQLTNPDHIEEAMMDCQAVIHTAANTNMNGLTADFYAFNTNSTRALVETAVRQKIHRFIFVSTANAFGYGTKKSPGHEALPPSPVFMRTGYAKSKVNAQKIVLEAVQQQKLNAIIVNPSFIIGPYDAKPSSGRILLMANQWFAFAPPGGKNFVSAKDAATAIVNGLINGSAGEAFILAGENLSYRQFFKKCQQLNQLPKVIITLPKPLLKLGARFGVAWRSISGKAIELTPANAKILCVKNYYHASKAQKELMMPQSGIDQAIKEALAWFRTQNMIS